MDPLFESAPFTGYVYPNETVIPWSVLIVVYPYLTGLVAGSFTVSSLYHVFGMQQFKPIARFAMLLALCLMVCVPLPLLLHLGHPERAFNAMITPHLTSAFAIFGYAASFYTVLLLLENWFVYRTQIIQIATEGKGPLKWICRVISLGSDDVSEKAMHYDHKWIYALAVIGIPAALGLHGYVGFVFGSLKSREWWSSDLMPPVFLLSAVISGTSLVVILYVLTCLGRKVTIEEPCIKGLAYTLWGFLMFALLLEGVEFASLLYRSREGIEAIMVYVTGRLVLPFFILQIGLGSFVPLLTLTYMIVRGVRGRALIAGVFVSSALVLCAVLLMRWNVVIGGQEISKTGKGLLTYQPELWGREGLIAAGSVLVAPLILMFLATRIVSPWAEETRAAILRKRAVAS
jgi:Ni/Fe-hydrogenase subunit HybB-like protein